MIKCKQIVKMYPVENIVCELYTTQNFGAGGVVKDFGSIEQDPLAGLGDVIEKEVYKLDQVVFADPIEFTNNSESQNGENPDHKFTFLDKVTVETRVGKRSKYHIELEDVSKPVCPKANCKKKFSTITILKAHIRKVHCAVPSHTCEVCGVGFTAKYLLARHMAVHDGSTVQCPVCSTQLSKRTSLSVHIQFVHKQGTLKCDKCDKRFARRSEYVRHKSLHRT